MMKRRTLLAGFSALPVAMLTGCGGGSDNETRVRLLNASKTSGTLDLYVDGDLERSGIAYGSASDYFAPDDGGGSYTLALKGGGSAGFNYSQDQSLSNRKPYTLIAYGAQGGAATVQAVLVEEDEDEDDIDNGEARLQIVNAATDGGPLDVFLTDANVPLDGAIALASSVAVVSGSLGSAGYTDVTRGTYRLRVTGPDDVDDVRLDIDNVVIPNEKAVNLVLASAGGGVLLDAFLLPQEDALVPYLNTSARVRLVASVVSGGSTNVQVAVALGGTAFASASTASVSPYGLVPAGASTLSATVNGATVNVPAQTLTAGADYSLLVYGDAAAPQAAWLADDNRLPSNSARAKMRLVNLLNGTAGTLTLTVQAAAAGSSVAFGAGSAYANVSNVGLNITVTVTSTDQAAFVYNNTDLTLEANAVYTVFALGTLQVPAVSVLQERSVSSTTSVPVPAASAASS